MRTFTRFSDPSLQHLPPPHRSVVEHALEKLQAVCGPVPDALLDGFVGYVEAQDTPESVSSAIGRDLSRCLEGAFRNGSCLVGVVLWGNSGAGVTLVCPQDHGHAPGVASLLRGHL